MTPQRQEWTGVALASLILGSWTALHIYTLFFFEWQNAPMRSVALILALVWLSVGLFIVAHDAMHGSLAPLHPRLGIAIGTVALQLYACFSYRSLLPEHHAHHAKPGTEEDPDFHPTHPTSYWRWYTRFFLHYFGVREAVCMCLRLALYIMLGAALSNILIFYALTAIASSFQLFTFGTWLPHRHRHAMFADDHRTTTNDYPAWLSLMTCFHFGYHHEHHLRPDFPWWRLPALRRSRRLSENETR